MSETDTYQAVIGGTIKKPELRRRVHAMLGRDNVLYPTVARARDRGSHLIAEFVTEDIQYDTRVNDVPQAIVDALVRLEQRASLDVEVADALGHDAMVDYLEAKRGAALGVDGIRYLALLRFMARPSTNAAPATPAAIFESANASDRDIYASHPTHASVAAIYAEDASASAIDAESPSPFDHTRYEPKPNPLTVARERRAHCVRWIERLQPVLSKEFPLLAWVHRDHWPLLAEWITKDISGPIPADVPLGYWAPTKLDHDYYRDLMAGLIALGRGVERHMLLVKVMGHEWVSERLKAEGADIVYQAILKLMAADA